MIKKKLLMISAAFFVITAGICANSAYADIKVTKIDSDGMVAVTRDGHILGAKKYDDNIYVPEYQTIGTVSEGMLAVCKDKKWGYVDTDDKLVISYKYDHAGSFTNGTAVVELNNKYGLIDKMGNLLTKNQYDNLCYYSVKSNTSKSDNVLFGADINGKYGFINSKGEEVIPLKYDSVKEFNNGISAVKENGKWGFIDQSGKVIVKPQYDDAGCIVVSNTKNGKNTSVNLNYVKKNNLYGFVNNSSEVVAEPQIKLNDYEIYDKIKFSEDMCPVTIAGKIGFINTSGKVVIKPQFDVMGNDCTPYSFSDGLCPVMKNNKWGYINKSGKIVVPAIYSYAGGFTNGFASISGDKGHFYINKYLKTVFNTDKYGTIVGGFSTDGLLCVELGETNKYGYVNTKGNVVIKPQYSNAGMFYDGAAVVTNKAGKSELIDAKGKVIFTADAFGARGGYGTGKAYDGLIEFTINGRHGLINTKGKIIVKPQYDSIDPSVFNGIIQYTNGSLSGYLDEKGKTIFNPIFINPGCFSDDYEKYAYPQLQAGCIVTVDNNGKTTNQIFSYAYPEAEGMVAVKKGNTWGYLDSNGKLKIPFQYDEAASFSEGRALVCVKGLYGYIDINGKMVIKPQFMIPGHCNGSYNIPPQSFSEGLAMVPNEDKYGYIDKNGKLIIPYKYELAYSFKEGVACVDDNGHIAYIDKTGKEVFKLNCDFETNYFDYNNSNNLSFNNGLAIVFTNTKCGFRDADGKEVIKAQYDDVLNYSEGFAAVKVGDLWGYIDEKGSMVIKPQFYRAADFSDGMAVVTNSKGLCGFIDKTGKLVVNYKYSAAHNFSEGYARVTLQNSNKATYIDKNGKLITALDIQDAKGYDGTGDFSDGLAAVEVGDYSNQHTGYMDSTGKIVLSEDGKNMLGDFSDGLASFYDKNGYGYINKKGEVVVKPIYNEVRKFNNGYAAVCKDKQWGFIDKNGKHIVKPKYDRAQDFTCGRAIVAIGSSFGAIDETGKEVIQLKYLSIEDFSNGIADAYREDNISGKYMYTHIYIDINGKEIAKFSANNGTTSSFKGNVANVVIDNSVNTASTANSGNAASAGNDGRSGKQSIYIDNTGKIILKPDYFDYNGGNIALKSVAGAKLYPIYVTGKYIYIDKTGSYVKDAQVPVSQ